VATKTEKLVQRLYPLHRKRRRKKGLFRPRHYLERIARWAKRHAWKLSFIGALLIVWMVAHIYYYNRLIDLEYNIQAGWAQVEAEQERRYNIQQDVTRLVIGYAAHERDLMTQLTELRTGVRTAKANGSQAEANEPSLQPASGGGGQQGAEAGAQTGPNALPTQLDLDQLSPEDLNRIFPQIMLTAEQYPNLRLTENFQQWSQAIIDTETRIAEHLQVYNQRVNDYTTLLKQFPGNIFGAVWGFEAYEFYVPERNTIVFRPVEYQAAPRYGAAPAPGPTSRDTLPASAAGPSRGPIPTLQPRPRRAPRPRPVIESDSPSGAGSEPRHEASAERGTGQGQS